MASGGSRGNLRSPFEFLLRTLGSLRRQRVCESERVRCKSVYWLFGLTSDCPLVPKYS